MEQQSVEQVKFAPRQLQRNRGADVILRNVCLPAKPPRVLRGDLRKLGLVGAWNNVHTPVRLRDIVQCEPGRYAVVRLHVPERRILMPGNRWSCRGLIEISRVPQKQVWTKQRRNAFDDGWRGTQFVGDRIIQVAVDERIVCTTRRR